MGISAFLTEKPPWVKTVKNYNILVHGKEARHLKLSGDMIDVENDFRSRSQGRKPRSYMQFCEKRILTKYNESINGSWI